VTSPAGVVSPVCPGEPGFDCHDDGAVLAMGLCRNCYHRRWGRRERRYNPFYNAAREVSRTWTPEERRSAGRAKSLAHSGARREADPAAWRAMKREASRRSRAKIRDDERTGPE